MKLIKISVLLFLVGTILSCGEDSEKARAKDTSDKTTSINVPENWNSIQTEEFSISHPKDWTADKSGQMGTKVFIFAPQDGPDDKFSENINLMTEKLPTESVDLDAYVAASESQINQYIEDSEILSSKRIVLNGKEFQNVSYTGSQNNTTLRFQQYYTLHKGHAYILTLTCRNDSYDQYKELGTQIMQTFKLD